MTTDLKGRPRMIHLLHKWLLKVQQNSPLQVSLWVCPLDKQASSLLPLLCDSVPFTLQDWHLLCTSNLLSQPGSQPQEVWHPHSLQETLAASGVPFCYPRGSLSYSKLTQGICFELVFPPHKWRRICVGSPPEGHLWAVCIRRPGWGSERDHGEGNQPSWGLNWWAH